MTSRHADRFGLTRHGLWILAVVLTLVVRPAFADEAARAEALRLADELKKSQAQIADLTAENKKLRGELRDEQLKNAIDADQEIKRLRDLLRGVPEKVALAKELKNEKDVGLKLRDEMEQLRAELEREKARSEDNAAFGRKAQAEIDRLSDDLLKKAAENRTLEKKLDQLSDQVAAVKQELAAQQPKKAEQPKPTPKTEPKSPDDGPTAEQLKRLADELRRREEAARQDALQARDQAEKARLEAQRFRELAEKARDEDERKRLAAEAREKERAAVVAPNADPARIEAEVRAAKLEAQLHVMQMAYTDLRREAIRLREELDAERKARHQQAPNSATADPKVLQRLDNLEAVVTKLMKLMEELTKKAEPKNPEQ